MIASKRKTVVTVATDLQQAIHRFNLDHILRFVHEAETTYPLSYCYRSSRQIMKTSSQLARALRESFNIADVSEGYGQEHFALSGPVVQAYECEDMREAIARSTQIVEDLEDRFDRRSLALIYLQYFNPAYKGGDREEAALKNHPILSRHYRFASLTKGREYAAGVVYVSSTFMARDMGARANQLRVNTLYVALTRFRDEVAIVFVRHSPLASILARELRLGR